LSLKTTSANSSETKKYTLSTTENTIIGRSPECQISLDPYEFITVSRRHAEIKLVDTSWQISDLGATNGTLVNDRPINHTQQLESGDRITLGAKGPEYTFECLTLNTTVMVQSTGISAAFPPPVKPEASSKLANKPVTTADTEAKKTIPASKEVQSAEAQSETESKSEPLAELSQAVEIEPEPNPEPRAKPEIEPKSESLARKEPEPKPNYELEAQEETSPKAAFSAVEDNQSQSPAPSTVQSVNFGKTVNSGKTLWSLVSLSQWGQILGHSQPLLSLAFSPDGQILASTAKDKTIKLWSMAEGTEIATLTGHKLAPNALAFNPDGQIIASGGADKTIKLWNIARIEEIASFAAHKLTINALAYSPDGQTIASGSKDKTIKLWNVASTEETATLT
ncbi:MAG: FHA domain-containing protein, partial [Cyanobacteria bacterium J06638_38]